MPMTAGPQQTDTWPLVWADLDPKDLPGWVVWQRTCEREGVDGQACPRRMVGIYFGVRRCDHHWPPDVAIPAGQVIG